MRVSCQRARRDQCHIMLIGKWRRLVVGNARRRNPIQQIGPTGEAGTFRGVGFWLLRQDSQAHHCLRLPDPIIL